MKSKTIHKAFEHNLNKEFGGSLLKGNPRIKRPIALNKPMHLVLRSSFARGSFSMNHKRKRIEKAIQTLSKNLGVKVYRFAIAGNHIHLLIVSKTRKAYSSFIRAVSGIVARIILSAERGKASFIDRFWDSRPYTRIMEWGRDFIAVSNYIDLNKLEAIGFSLISISKNIHAKLITRYSG